MCFLEGIMSAALRTVCMSTAVAAATPVVARSRSAVRSGGENTWPAVPDRVAPVGARR